jgi:hypothetical protein
MTQEEKFEEAKRLYETANADQKYVLERLFPELKENEDERIRKWIVDELKDSLHNIEALYSRDYDNRDKDDIIREDFLRKALAWLEKQGDKDKLIQELGEYKVKYTQEVLEKCMNKKDDERLRKTTIDFLKEFADKGYENAVECIDWLEKQGETSHQLGENSATAKGLDDELEAFLCKYEEVSGEEKARLIGVAEHFYLIGKNQNANL